MRRYRIIFCLLFSPCFFLTAQTTGNGTALTAEGKLAFQRGDYLAAARAYEQALPLVKSSGDEAELGRLYKYIGDVYGARSYFRQAIDNYREALPLLKKTEQNRLQVDCLEKMAGIQAEFGYPNAAITHFTRALKIQESLGDQAGAAFCHSRLSRLNFAENHYAEALEHNREVLRLAGDDFVLETDAAIQDVVILTFLGRLEEAEKSLQNARSLLASRRNSSADIKLYSAISTLYLAKKDQFNAEMYLDSAKILLKGSQNPELAIAGLEQIALIQQKNGDYESACDALRQLDRYKDIFRNQNVARISAEINDAAATALREKEIEALNLGNQLKAAELLQNRTLRLSLQRENLLQDSALQNQSRLLAALGEETKLRNEQLEREMSLNQSLNRENTLKEENLKQERRLKRLLWLGLGLFALLGGVIFYQYRKQQRKNAIIRRQSEELLVLNKEVHHRVKNNLQVISSMLDLQAESLPAQGAKAALKEAVLRVQAMAFIHQNLYQDDEAGTVNMPDYIAMLADHLFNAYNVRSDKFSVQLDIEPLRLHTDTAVPIGMILNELISNALKYAFVGRETGSVHILLRRSDNRILLGVRDDGRGLPPDFNPEQGGSFGYELIGAFARKLKATLMVNGEAGTEVQLLISRFIAC